MGATICDVGFENYQSAINPVNRGKVEDTIRDEIRQGNYVVSAIKPRIASALGAIPKAESSELRLIHDCSRPHGQAVNDYITTHFKLLTTRLSYCRTAVSWLED